MKNYYFKIIISLCFLLTVFGCANKKKDLKTDLGIDDTVQKTVVAEKSETDHYQNTQNANEISAEELERLRKLEQQKRNEALMSESENEFQNVNIYFNFDSAELSLEARSLLNKKAEWMRQNPNTKILIEGHCDEKGTTEYNLALGQRRAEVAKEYLVALGINKKRIETVSYGEEKPAVHGFKEDSLARNRRDVFVITSRSFY